MYYFKKDNSEQDLSGFNIQKNLNGFSLRFMIGDVTVVYPPAPDVRGKIAVSAQRSLSVSPPEWSSVSGSPSNQTPSLSPCQKCRYGVCVIGYVFLDKSHCLCDRKQWKKERLTAKMNMADTE